MHMCVCVHMCARVCLSNRERKRGGATETARAYVCECVRVRERDSEKETAKKRHQETACMQISV